MENIMTFLTPALLMTIAFLLILLIWKFTSFTKSINVFLERRMKEIKVENEATIRSLNEVKIGVEAMDSSNQKGLDKIIDTLNEVTKID